ncbi:MAG: xanthine dehydrogenase family protein molybdopterin-binding subunit [Deltaproteobacteria bacterium]|nr:xanthine dehydrogenase family protein molybdopterin-binding subunit [Deltaproteobacteria bacterium]
MATKYRFIGKATPRKDALEIVQGKAQFIDDVKRPGMLCGKVLRSPYPHAGILKIDTTKAEALPGVRAVLTYKNVPDWKGGVPRHVKVLDNKVRFVGDGVALVAADTEEQANKALEQIEVVYEELPAVYDVEEAIQPDAPQLYEEFPRNLVPTNVKVFGPKTLSNVVMGDVDKGFKEADFIGEGTYAYENVANPLPLEPPGVIAEWQGPDQLTVWSATQSASWHRFIMVSKMGFPDIRAISTHCGGSFGSKNYSAQPLFYAAALSKVTGKPVKVMYTKEEQFGAFVLRLGSRFRGKVGIKKDGTVTAVSGEWFVDTGAFSDMAQAQVAVGCGEAQLMLRCANWDLQTKLVLTNRSASGVVRGFGGQELESAFHPILSIAMEQANLDPVEFFKKNYVKPGDGYYWREGNWWVCRGKDYSKAVVEGAKAFKWKDKWKGWLVPTAVDGSKRVGVGVGVHGNADVGEDDSEAYVRLNPDGTAVIHACVSESGMGQRSSLCKMAAEVLQIPLERVDMTPPDTLINPFDFGLVGSRGTYAVGSAVIAAAEDARRKILEVASSVLHAPPEELETTDGKVYVKTKPDSPVPWSRITGIMQTCTGFGRFTPDYSVPNFLILFVQVEVDIETGKVVLQHVVAATDAGQVIDPPSLEGQIYGSFGSAGTDTAIFEESVTDRKNGHLLNMNMIDYKWRTFSDLPEFRNVILETGIPSHRFKAVGVGEIATSPGPSAVLMAASNAVGKRLCEYPLTPEKILKALGKIKGA